MLNKYSIISREEFIRQFLTQQEQKPEVRQPIPRAPTPPIVQPEPEPESGPWGFTTPGNLEDLKKLLLENPQQTAPQQPQQPQYPSWLNQEFLPEEQEITPGTWGLEISETPWGPAPSQVNLGTVEGALTYLSSLNDQNLNNAVNLFNETDNIINNIDIPDKVKADKIGQTIAELNKIKTLSGKNEITQVVNTLSAFLGDKTEQLSPNLQNRVNKTILQEVEGPKTKQLQPLTSPYHGENIRYTRNRAIEIIQNEGRSVQEAEDQAKSEWNRINEIVDGTQSNFNTTDKENLKVLFGKQVIGKNSFEEAEQYITALMARGPDPEQDNFYKDIPDNINTEEILIQLSSEAYVEEEIEDIPDNEEILAKILEFSGIAQQLFKLGENWQERMKSSRGQIQPPIDVQLQANDLYQKAVSLTLDLSNLPVQVKQKAFNSGEIFKNIAAVMQQLNAYTTTFGIEQIDSENIVPEFENTVVNIVDPTRKKTNYPRTRNKEVEDRARQRYLDAIRSSGRIEDYYKKRQEYHKGPVERGRGEEKTFESPEEFKTRKNFEEEKRRIRNPDVDGLNQQIVKWKYLAFTKGGPTDLRTEIRNLINHYIKITNKLFERASKSWLDQDQLNSILNQRYQDRIKKYTDTVKFLESRPRQVNFYVLQAIKKLLENIPQIQEDAKNSTQISESQKFEPGIWSEKERNKISNTLKLTDLFFKYLS